MLQSIFGWRWRVAACVAVVAVSVLLVVWRRNSHALLAKDPERAAPPAAAEANETRVDLAKPTVGGIERQTVQPGSVIAFESADLFAKVSGYLKSQEVDIGSRVKQGDVLARIDAPEFVKAVEQDQAAVTQAKAQVVQAQARVATAVAEREAAEAAVKQSAAEVDRTAAVRAFREKQYARIKSLYELKSIDERLVDEKLDEMEAARASEAAAKAAVLTAKAHVGAAQAKVDQAEADLADAQANVDVAQAALAKAQVFVDYSQIVSPYDGVVTKRKFFRGDFIRSADQGGLVPLLGVSRTDLMRVVVQVPDRDVPFIHSGNEAKIQIDALPGSQFTGKVSRMADAEDPETRTMRVEIDLANTRSTLREGMYGRVKIHLDQLADALTIPSSCLVGTVNEGEAEVFVVQSGVARRRKVRIGADNGLRMEVLEGLTTADRVVRRHNGALTDGTRVRVVSEDEGSAAKQEATR
jgi:RND family efflux transporter MFP subunit